ncbi:protein phosphatase S phase [Scheffersomyces coipomensis]|uniref:protein phosphatase S phase n=1 Tax=Scheffersomyces coipomensis TaxID=1788519 RepID=UPI00315DEAD5
MNHNHNHSINHHNNSNNGATAVAVSVTNPNTNTGTTTTLVKSPSLTSTTSLSSTNSTSSNSSFISPMLKSSKRSSSTSNDLLYERDRFRARLQSFNNALGIKEDTANTMITNIEGDIPKSQDDPDCDVCDGIGSKTTKLNIRSNHNHTNHTTNGDAISIASNIINLEMSPLSHKSSFYKNQLLFHPLSISSPFTIKLLNLTQLKYIFNWYFNEPLPKTNEMFPWLHGLNKDNFAQKQFFLHQQQQMQRKLLSLNPDQVSEDHDLVDFNEYKLDKPKGIRFLMCINKNENDGEDDIILKNTIKLNEILQKIEVSKLEVKNILVEILTNIQMINDIDLSVILQDCITLNCLPIFLNLDPDRGISLRNFHIQVSKLSTCSDFIIYSSSLLNSPNLKLQQSISRILWISQRYEHYLNNDSDGIEPPEYNVFILNETKENMKDQLLPFKNYHHQHHVKPTISNFSKIESKFLWEKYKRYKKQQQQQLAETDTSTITPSSASRLIWDNDYQIKEKIETTRMSSATKLDRNVWCGNYWDYQISLTFILEKDNTLTNLPNPKDLLDFYCQPKNSIVYNHQDTNPNLLDYLSLPRSNWRLFIYCHNDATFPDLSSLSNLLFKSAIQSHNPQDLDIEQLFEYHLLEFPPSGSIGIGDCKRENLMSIINTCKLIYVYSSSSSKNLNSFGSLIYCSDGYTESSLLVLCYLMYSKNIGLDDAMLQLHLQFGRPFYIFNSDVIILKKLEGLLNKISPENPEYKDKIIWNQLEQLSSIQVNELLLGRPSPSKINKSYRLGFIENDDEDEDEEEEEEVDIVKHDDEEEEDDNWVKEVEGSIPSKILPYLYLGSLKHANCLPLLNKLGIKKIISVGEVLDWLNGHEFKKFNDIDVEQIDDGNIEMYNISPSAKRKAHLSQQKKNKHKGSSSHHQFQHHLDCSIDSVMKVNNLEDDGIDELTRSLPTILEYINNEYLKSNGNTKIFIHCRVGVSRSATVVIAEVMRRLNINLSTAYLYVRVRRLNIIIQPNLRFMYELFKWEELQKLKARQEGEDDGSYLREIDWFMMCREIMKLNIPYLSN